MPFTSGTSIADRYEVVKTLGSGTVGTVYHVLDRTLDRQSLALKVLHLDLINDNIILKRFHNEVMLARQLAHPHIARVYDLEQIDNAVYLTMEYVAGCDLEVILNSYSGRRMPCKEVRFILTQLAEGLSFAHQKNVVHRDLKPQNILLDRSGLVKLTDFGLAHGLESSLGLTKTGEAPGTPAYMAPEQFLGAEPDPRIDVYAFGILAYEMLTGKLPFIGNNFYSTGEQHRSAPLPLEPLQSLGLPDWLVKLVVDCTTKDSSQRTLTMTEVAGRLHEHRGNDDVQSKTQLRTVVRQQQRSNQLFSRQNINWIRSLSLLAVVVTFVLAVLWHDNSRRQLSVWLLPFEKELGYDTKFARDLISFGRYSALSANDILECARVGKSIEMETLIATGANLGVRDALGETVFHIAVRRDSLDLIYALLKDVRHIDARNFKGETPLMLAVKAGNISHVGILLAKGASASVQDKTGTTPFLWAVSVGDLELVRLLLTSGTNRNGLIRSRKTFDGRTAVHLAAERGRAEILDLLLHNSFDADVRDSSGLTPLMRLVQNRATPTARQTFQVLLNHQASLKARDDLGQTVFDYAATNTETYWQEILQANKANL